MEYNNILNAINGMNQQNPTMDDLNRRNENYRLVDKLNQEGVSLKDALGQIEELKREIKELKKPSKAVDEDLFAVKDDPMVIEAKHKVSEEKTRVIAELCAKAEDLMATGQGDAELEATIVQYKSTIRDTQYKEGYPQNVEYPEIPWE